MIGQLPSWYIGLSIYVTLLGVLLLYYVLTRRRAYIATLSASAAPEERARLSRVQVRSTVRAMVLTLGGPLLLLDHAWVQVLLVPTVLVGISKRVRDIAIGVAVAREAETLGIEPQESRAATITPRAVDYAASVGLQVILRVAPAAMLVLAIWFV